MSSDAGHTNSAYPQAYKGDASETEMPVLKASSTSQGSTHAEDPLLVMNLILEDLQALHDRFNERGLLDVPLPLQK